LALARRRSGATVRHEISIRLPKSRDLRCAP
jgi:hypothetical protein